MNAHKTPLERIRDYTRRIWLWRILAYLTAAWAIYDPENRYLMAWVIFMSAHALEVGYEAARAGAEPSAKEE